VHEGLERWSQVLMPLLVAMLLFLLFRSITLDGFGEAFEFVFGLHADRLTPAGVLEALGHSFFTLGIGVGIMLTYGSYLKPGANIVRDSVAVAVLDTAVALLACLVIFPITFTFGLEASEGPGLVFTTLPVAFAQLPGGGLLAVIFFGLLVFAALTSSISMLESATAYLVDERGWTRKRAAFSAGGLVVVLMVPAALTGATTFFGSGMEDLLGKNWFDLLFDSVSNLAMPLGGLGFALYCGWRLGETTRRAQFPEGFSWRLYRGWLLILRWLVPAAVVVIFLHAVGLI
jgi:NSS family neurotransmitter:Na+ symporter